MTNQNSIQEEIKCRLKAGNSCYYSVQTLLFSRLLSKNLKIKIYKTIILLVMLYGYKTWSLTLREECRLRVFENRILKWILGPKRDEKGEWRRLHNEELHSFKLSIYLSSWAWRIVVSVLAWTEGHVIVFLQQADGSRWSFLTQKQQQLPGFHPWMLFEWPPLSG